MDLLLLGVLIALMIVILFVVLKGQQNQQQSPDLASKLDSSLKEQFLTFQSNIHSELNSTRQEVARSKDVMSEHALKTFENIKDMGGNLHKFIQQQEDFQKLGQSLKDLLQAPKLRGNYSEAILEEMLDQALPKGVWQKQYVIDGLDKVDAVIKLKDVVVPIDAKFPRDDYQKYMEAETEAAKKQCWKDYEGAVKTQIKSISGKYIKPEKGTTDFAFMFIPSEAIYYETIADKNHLGDQSKLQEYARSCKVIPVSPNTFYAHLQTVLLGFQNVEILKGARKMQEGLSTVEKSFGLFYKKYEDIGKHIDKAQDAYRIGDSHILNYKRKLESTLQLEGFKQEAPTLPENTSNN